MDFLRFVFEFYTRGGGSTLKVAHDELGKLETWISTPPRDLFSLGSKSIGLLHSSDYITALRKDVPKLERGGLTALPALWRIRSGYPPYRNLREQIVSALSTGNTDGQPPVIPPPA